MADSSTVPVVIVTRLRQRRSVDAEEVNSPLTPSTPTKKRGRTAAKPQLELIDENASENGPKKGTKKSAAKEIEPIEEKVATPSRRSARIKSNTSIASETTVLDSPRSRRATRRNSHIGSDTETPLTPAKQTRRTRKESTSSIDKPIDTMSKSKIDDIIIEEVDAEEYMKKSLRNRGKNNSNDPDKTLSDKVTNPKNTKTKKGKNTQPEIDSSPVTTHRDAEKLKEETTSLSLQENNSITLEVNNDEKENLSISSSNLLNNMNMEPKKISDFFNKSTPNLMEPSKFKSKKHRTKSFTMVTTDNDKEASFLSDNESTKKKFKKNSINFNINKSFGDNVCNSTDSPKILHSEMKHDLSQDSINPCILLPDERNKSNGDVQNYTEEASDRNDEKPSTSLLLQKKPSDFQVSVLFESDSNSSLGKKDDIQNLYIEDQCVPVVDTKADISCEPMDIDETIAGDVFIHDNTGNSVSSELIVNDHNKSQRKTSVSSIRDSIEERKNPRLKKNSIELENQVSSGNEISQNTVKITENVKISKGKASTVSEAEIDTNKEIDESNRNSLQNITLDNTSGVLNSDPNKLSRKSLPDSSIGQQNLKNSPKISKRKSSAVIENCNNEHNDSKSNLCSSYTQLQDLDSKKEKEKPTENSSITITMDGSNQVEDIAVKRKYSNNTTYNESNVSNSYKRKSSVTFSSQDNTEDNKDKSKTVSSHIIPSEDSKSDINYRPKKNSSANDSREIAKNINDSCNKSGRKLSETISHNETITNCEKTGNESKSTLILSQINDISHETSNLCKSPKSYKKDLMSKSLNTPNVPNKDCDKKNISDNCLTTSTPLQQKPLKKLGLSVDTSDIGINNKNKAKSCVIKKKHVSEPVSYDESSDSNKSNSGDDDSSMEDSNMLDDEAEEASDDYESGDSRDEKDREHEEENEIPEKGETLDSEEDFSNDSDYEKDSFVVSSDEEDYDLLSGSGDDLRMSDNELTMSKKSKDKYNIRKNKEQKKASKQMYEARHKLDASEENMSKGKKSRRQRLDSSMITMDDEKSVKEPKNYKRLIVNSSCGTSDIESDLNTSENKKKDKRISESLYDKSALNEKEITVDEHNKSEKDPLFGIKLEPQTPKNDFDVSTVHVTHREDVEEVQVEENMSIIRQDETSDPLQATIRADNNSESSLSENEEIIQNYDSVLNNLDSIKPKQVKSVDVSLNIQKKTKKNAKHPVFDQLNLTEIKSKKSKIKHKIEPIEDKAQIITSDAESESISMRLLFPEDSNDSEVNVYTFKTKENMTDKAQDFIPLKKSEGTTNISLGKDNEDGDDSILQKSKKKKNRNKKTSEQSSSETVQDTFDSGSLSFFVDTEGTQEDSGIGVNTSKTSKKKKHKKNTSADITITEDVPLETYTNDKIEKETKITLPYETNIIENDDTSNEAPLEVSFVKKMKKKEKHSLDHSKTTTEDVNIGDVVNTPHDTQGSKKKKKSKHSKDIQEATAEDPQDVTSGEVIEEIFKINKKKSIDNSHNLEDNCHIEDMPIANESHSKKKKAKKLQEECIIKDQGEENITDKICIKNTEETGSISKKRKRKLSANTPIEAGSSQDAPIVEATKVDDSMESCKKKKRKIENEEQAIDTVPTQENADQNKVNDSKKKKKTKLKHQEPLQTLTPETTVVKNKKRKGTDNDDTERKAKVLKQHSSDKIHVSRLPDTIINQLCEKPKPRTEKKKLPISTTPFVVEEVLKRSTKPSNYLEESIFLNDSPKPNKQKYPFKSVKVLPFIPTATTSYKGFTTDFKVKILDDSPKSAAQASSSLNFKNNYLQNKRIKKLGTLEKYKMCRNTKMSKF